MAVPSTAMKCLDESDVSPEAAPESLCARRLSGARTRRGVLDGAFVVLETLAHAQRGLGLTELARSSGLAKTSAYRLAEQLVALGAVQRLDHRYYVGARIGRLGRRWQPDPVLRQAAAAPVHALAAQSRVIASLRILNHDALLAICTTVPPGQAYVPAPIDRETTARSATGRVLYAADDTLDIALLPDCWTAREWQQLRKSIRDPRATVIDHQEAFPGICCASAPVWWPNGRCAGALTALVYGPKLPPCLPDLVWHSARRIGAALQ